MNFCLHASDDRVRQVRVHGACTFCLFHSLFCFFLNYYLYVPPVNFLLLFSPCAFFFFFVLSKTKAFEFLLACLRWPWCQVRVHGACTFCLFHSVFYFFLTYCLYVPVNFLLLFFPCVFFFSFVFKQPKQKHLNSYMSQVAVAGLCSWWCMFLPFVSFSVLFFPY